MRRYPVTAPCSSQQTPTRSQPSATFRLGVGVQAEQRQRQVERREQLDVRQLRDPIRRERICKPGKECGGSAAREVIRQRVHREPAQRIREQKGHVVRPERVAAHPVQRCRHHADAKQMLENARRRWWG